MFFNNWRSSANQILIGCAVVLSAILPQPVFSQSGGGRNENHETKLIQELQEKVNAQEANYRKQLESVIREKQRMQEALKDAHRELEQRGQGSPPPSQQTETHVFDLEHIHGHVMVETILGILGRDELRLSQVSAHRLVVNAEQETLDAVAMLIKKLDHPEVVSETLDRSGLPQTLMARIFWLSDGPTYPDARSAEESLPSSVISALTRIGIEDAFFVLQSNTSIALGDDRAQFEVEDVPATVFGERWLFGARGEVHAAGDDRIRLQMEAATIRVDRDRKSHENHIRGSMITPLGHYMVLGTANFASLEGENPSHANERFAFVVQMVEAESFAPDK
jgi:hypothetical protein